MLDIGPAGIIELLAVDLQGDGRFDDVATATLGGVVVFSSTS